MSLKKQSAILSGKRPFTSEEFFVPQHITSYLSRTSRQINSKYNDGIAKSKNEIAFITHEVWLTFMQTHKPVVSELNMLFNTLSAISIDYFKIIF